MKIVVSEISAGEIIENRIKALKLDREFYAEGMGARGEPISEILQFRTIYTRAFEELELVYREITALS